ncbi:3-phosphoshikimate 1-carboxyvinyltransferase [Candidatus Woesearchaeota archaeon]|nr:3-phosphoshikimate 1-carboxyvinyltransferase [Candidatus Woesearchaeota archaeon]
MDLIEIIPWEKGRDNKVEVPGSKSHTQRELIVSALSNGQSKISNLLECDDSEVMIDALMKSGVFISPDMDSYVVCPLKSEKHNGEIYTGAAGTSMRFLTSYFAALKGKTIISGTGRMHQRPIDDLVDALNNIVDGNISTMNANSEGRGCPPVAIDTYGIRGGRTSLKGDTSSQYLSSMMMVAPLAKEDVEIDIIGKLTSKPYVDMTIAVMQNHGVGVENQGYRKFIIRGNQRYESADSIIETDASSLSYVLEAAMLTGTTWESKLTMDLRSSIQGDSKFMQVMDVLGGKNLGSYNDIIYKGPNSMSNIRKIDMNSMTDCVQTFGVIAACTPGITEIYNVANIEHKESKRLTTLKAELEKVDINSELTSDGIIIYGRRINELCDAEIDTHHDHRLALSFSILGLAVPGIRIKDPGVITKSWPTFFEDMGITYRVIR